MERARLDIRLQGKEAGKEARAKAGAERVPDTQPAHPLEDYTGEYAHPACGGDVTIEFIVEDGKVTAMKQVSPSGAYVFPRE